MAAETASGTVEWDEGREEGGLQTQTEKLDFSGDDGDVDARSGDEREDGTATEPGVAAGSNGPQREEAQDRDLEEPGVSGLLKPQVTDTSASDLPTDVTLNNSLVNECERENAAEQETQPPGPELEDGESETNLGDGSSSAQVKEGEAEQGGEEEGEVEEGGEEEAVACQEEVKTSAGEGAGGQGQNEEGLDTEWTDILGNGQLLKKVGHR